MSTSTPSSSAASGPTDPLAPLGELPGVAEAVAETRRAVDRLYGHRVMRRRAAEVTSEAALRGARASAALEGANWPLEEVRRRTDFGRDAEARLIGGALRLNAEVGQLLGTWRHSPLQVLARLHLLAVGDEGESVASTGVVAGEASEGAGVTAVGRPRRADEPAEVLFRHPLAATEKVETEFAALERAFDLSLPPAPSAAEVSARLDTLAQLLASRGGTKHPNERTAPALVVAAVVHGELLALRPFTSANGLVARAATRIVLIAEGLDPKAICPMEVGLAELGNEAYLAGLMGYASGAADGMAAWIAHCAQALRLGVRESTAVCEAMQRGMA
ncbi:Fic family protein [Streptacidiphilus neutrinimicus]|uniref:Fic family protein n=1 Tax=Streptacidiphilus neutrinimicus TaxID=105420 RepID=UPI0005A843D5|nr:Fic family protein [Streptacidiphilus neutrinimicus]